MFPAPAQPETDYDLEVDDDGDVTLVTTTRVRIGHITECEHRVPDGAAEDYAYALERWEDGQRAADAMYQDVSGFRGTR